MKSRRLWRNILLTAAAMPLLSTTCVDIMQRSLINGFFDAVTPLLLEQLEDSLESHAADS